MLHVKSIYVRQPYGMTFTSSTTDYGRHVLNQMPAPAFVDWNSIIRRSINSSHSHSALLLYANMRRSNVSPDHHTFPNVLKSCAHLRTVSMVHGQVFRFGLQSDVFVVSALIRRYSGCGELEHAVKVFELSSNRNVVCWTSLISGCCGCGRVTLARQLFDEMPERNDSAWSAMISGYVQNEMHQEAMELFRVMRTCSRVEPNGSLMVSMLNTCTGLGAMEEGRRIHAYIDGKGLEYGLEIGTALVDFYVKIGSIENAWHVFEKMPCKDVTAWSAMIMGLAINGDAHMAIRVFQEMLGSGTKPNAVTFIGVLSACSHGGLVDVGWRFFQEMDEVHGIPAVSDHYGCMVDLLARAGMIEDAHRLIRSMPFEPDAAVWGALLNGCIMHRKEELGETTGRILVKLEPQHASRYVGLANIYASMGSWQGVIKVRRMMRGRGVGSDSGWSSIEMDGGMIHRFRANDRNHRCVGEIYNVLLNIKEHWNDDAE